MADVEKEFERLRRLLIRVKYSQSIDRSKILNGETTELLPLLHYGLLSFSKLLAKEIEQSGHDLFGKNDLRFTEGVYLVLRKEFGYNPVLQCSQFLTDKGYAKRKIMLVADAMEIVLKKHKILLKKRQRKESSKIPWHETDLAKKIDANIQKQKHEKEKAKERERRAHMKRKHRRKKKQQTHNEVREDKPNPEQVTFQRESGMGMTTSADSSCEMREPPIPTQAPMLLLQEQSETKTPEPEISEEKRDEESEDVNEQYSPMERLLEEEEVEKEYDPESYVQRTNATMEISNPEYNPYLESQELIDGPAFVNNATLTVIEEEEVGPQETAMSTRAAPHSSQPAQETAHNESDDGHESPAQEDDGNREDSSDTAKHKESSHSGSHPSEHGPTHTVTQGISAILERLERLEKQFAKHSENVNARLVVVEGKLRFLEAKITTQKPVPAKGMPSNIPTFGTSLPMGIPPHVRPPQPARSLRPITSHRKTDDDSAISTSNGDHSVYQATIGSPAIPSSLTSTDMSSDKQEKKTAQSKKDQTRTQPVAIVHPPASPFIGSAYGPIPTGNGFMPFYPYAPPLKPSEMLQFPLSSSNGTNGDRKSSSEVPRIIPPLSSSNESNDSISNFMRTLQERLEHTDQLLESTKPGSSGHSNVVYSKV